jgi:hypothetical protein
MPVTLYDGAVASLPGSCVVVAASSINLIGTMRAMHLTNLGSGWVVSTPPNGGRIHGGWAHGRGGRVPSGAHRQGCLLYRLCAGGWRTDRGELPQRGPGCGTIGKRRQPAGALAQAGTPAVATWIGSVTEPPARSSADCRNAALVIEQAAAGVSALWSGSYKGTRSSFAADVWPGDALLLNAPSTSLNAQVVVRTVKVSYSASYPDLVEYAIAFANDWADDLAIKTSATVPADAWLPAPVAPTLLANLTGLAVTTLTGSTVHQCGITPPRGRRI